MGRKKKSRKPSMAITITIFSISCAVGGLGGVSLLRANINFGTDTTTTSTKEINSPEIPMPETPTNVEDPINSEPLNKPEPIYEQDVSQPVPTVIIIKDSVNENTDNIKANNKPIISVSNTESKDDSSDNIKEVSKLTIENTKNDEMIEGKDTFNEETEQKEMDESESLESDNINETLQTKASCKFNIENPSQLVLVSDSEIDQNGIVNISYASSETEEVVDIGSYELAEVVNTDENSSDSQKINYMDISSGTFIFMFENCNFDNIDFYLLNSDELSSDNLYDNEYDDENDIVNISIPSQEEFQVKMDQENSSCRIKIIPSCTFQPLIVFRSEENIDGIMKISDELENELLDIELEQRDDDNTQTFIPSFELEEGEQYYIEINSSSIEGLLEYIYYFEISTPMIHDIYDSNLIEE